MSYISWTDFTATTTGRAIKEVTCEHCQVEYLYAIERSATGQGTAIYHINEQGAHERAQDRAAANLQRYLENDFDLVPCPSCGSYQSQMVAFLQRSHRIWMFLLAWLLFLLAGVALIIALLCTTVSRYNLEPKG